MKWTNNQLLTDTGELIGTLYQAGWGYWHLLLADGKQVLTTNWQDKLLAINAIEKKMGPNHRPLAGKDKS